MSRIEESLYNSVSKYGIRVDENINKPSRRSRLTEDLIDDFYDTFDPDGDHESGLMAHDGAELDAWINWLDDHGMDYEMEYSDDPDYEAYVIINESVKPRHRKYLNESDYNYEITNKGYTKDDIKKVKSQIANKRVLYTARPGEGAVAKLRKDHPNYTVISRENAEKINQIDLHSINGLILDGIEKFPNEVMGKLLTIMHDTPIPVLAVTYNKDKLDQAVINSFRFGGVRVGESYHMSLDEKVNQDNAEVNAIIRKYLKKRGTPTAEEQAILDKYGITYNRDKKTFNGPNGETLYWTGYDDGWLGPNRGIIKPGTFISQNADNFEKADYANMLNKKHYNGDMRSSRNSNAYNTDKRSIYDLKRHMEAIKADLDYFMQRYEEAVEENDQHDMAFYADRIDERQKRIDRLQQEIDYTMMFARQDHESKMSKTKNESYSRKMNEKLDDDTYDDFEVEMAEAVTDIMDKYGASVAEVKQAFKTIQNVYL